MHEVRSLTYPNLRVLRGEIHRSHVIVNASVSYDARQTRFAFFAANSSSSLTAGASAGRRAG